MLFILLLLFFSSLQPNVLYKQTAQILNTNEYSSLPTIISSREWAELHLDQLISKLDRTHTCFGHSGLIQLLHPINNKQELLKRQHIIIALIENQNSIDAIQKELKNIRHNERSLLSFWNKEDKLHNNAKQFYFSSRFFKPLNNNSIALTISSSIEMFNYTKYLMINLALSGFSNEIWRWIDNEKTEFNGAQGIMTGLQEPIKQHSLRPFLFTDPQFDLSHKNHMRAVLKGSWHDRYAFYSRWISHNKFTSFLNKVYLDKLLGTIGATLPTIAYDYQWVNSVASIIQKMIFTYRTLNAIQQRVCAVAKSIESIIKIRNHLIHNAPQLKPYFALDIKPEAQDFLKRLLSPRFLEKPGYLYSPGHALTMYKEICTKRNLLTPLLQTLAFLDAYCSIAQIYTENSSYFSFPEFVDTDEPFLEYENAWIPFLSPEKAVFNTLLLGNKQPGKIIITGPNGGGKSTILREIGIIAVLAQAGLPVPATKARQSLFSSIQTSFVTDEDQRSDLSKFMAEEKAMKELREKITHTTQEDRLLILIDEPYRGTVDAESGKRIYNFGKDIASSPQALVAIATHVKKPISLEQDTLGLFKNYHVEIAEISPGFFKRLFKLKSEPAWWWFEDDENNDKRSRFVNWISTQV